MRAGAEHSMMFFSYRSLKPSFHTSSCRIFVIVPVPPLVLVLVLVLVLLLVVVVVVESFSIPMFMANPC